MAEIGALPASAAKAIRDKGSKARFDVARIDEIEKVTRHDVIAFLTHLSEIVGPDARFVHLGLTSSDVLDTCLAVQLARASDILIADSLSPASGSERWSDFAIAPNVGRVHTGKSFAMLWETYDLQAMPNGNVSYTVTITLRREKGGGLGALAAKIIGGVRSAIGISGSGSDRSSLTFPRQAPGTSCLVQDWFAQSVTCRSSR